MYMHMCIYTHRCIYVYVYTYMNMFDINDLRMYVSIRYIHAGNIHTDMLGVRSHRLHPVSVRRFPSFRTQPLENLTPLHEQMDF